VTIEAKPAALSAAIDRQRAERALRNLAGAAAKLLGAEGSIRVLVGMDGGDALIVVEAELPTETEEAAAPSALDLNVSESRVSLELAVASTIAQLHGGSVRIQNTAAGGVAFRLTLPRTPPAGDGGQDSVGDARAIGRRSGPQEHGA
jgi:K+-sensing histidine kinase KdpD